MAAANAGEHDAVLPDVSEGREAIAGTRGRGWNGMLRRAEAIGASIRFEAGASGGVAISLQWPLAEA